MPIGIIESLDHEGRGITRLDGKTIFVEGALPLEEVEYSSYRKKPSYEQAQTTRILKAANALIGNITEADLKVLESKLKRRPKK